VTRQRALAHLDISTGPGLEVAPLARPLVEKREADVRYVDIRSAAGLRQHYHGDPAVPAEDIVDLDYVLLNDSGVLRIAEACAKDGPFTWCVASHVIEHVPDFIGWLADIGSVMADAGRLSLVIPDRRYCFDALRPETTVGEMLLAHFSGDARPSLRAVFDFFSLVVHVDTPAIWRGELPTVDNRLYTPNQAWDYASRARGGEYVDCHVWLFTPTSFIDHLDLISQLDLLDFSVIDVLSTQTGELEFYTTLERLPRRLSKAEKRERFQHDLRHAKERLQSNLPANTEAQQRASEVGSSRAGVLLLSDRELRVVIAKRRVLAGIRRVVRRT
jgi:hypothetical protein